MMKKFMLGIFSILSFGSVASASASSTFESDLQAATNLINSQPNNPDAYTKRMNILSKAGRYQEAANDLAKQCSLTTDPDIRQLCEMELSEYKKIHQLQ